jgi:nucleoside-diphosphate-sugar epimerase
MRLLVTGASGFIGRNVLLRTPRAWEIWAVDHQVRTLGWFNLYQQLSKNYGLLPQTSEAIIRIVMIHLMFRRLARTGLWPDWHVQLSHHDGDRPNLRLAEAQ